MDDVHELHDMTVSSLPASCLGVRVRRSTIVNLYGYFLLLTEYLLCMRILRTEFMDTTLSLFLLVYPIHYWFGAFIADSAPSQNSERKK